MALGQMGQGQTGQGQKCPTLPRRNVACGMLDTSQVSRKILFGWGAVAQLGERVVRNDEVVGSIPICSTKALPRLDSCRSAKPDRGLNRRTHDRFCPRP